MSDPAARRAATRRLVDGAPRTAYDQLMRTALIVLALGLGACGDTAWILPEADAIAIADAELASRGLTADDRGHTVATSLVTLQLDGWSATAKLGFEYVGDPDPELGAASPYADLVGAEELQAAVDAAVGADTHVLVIHTWAHETEALCRDQYLRARQGRLDALAP